MPRRAARRVQPSTDDAPGVDLAERAPLGQYGAMRDFARTPEPPPNEPSTGSGPLTFVVQKHRATRLHYDVRLEVDGVMPSWPVPKGPSPDPVEKRLAVKTEDHPLDYAVFEGLIPKGSYGAGEVIVWDRGTYSPDENGVLSFHDREEANRRMRDEIAAGKVSVHFRGHRLKGSWTLVKTKQSENSWLMMKHRDEAAQPKRDLTDEDTSVLSGLTIADLQAGRLPPRDAVAPPLNHALLPGAVAGAPFPDTLEPMHATPAPEPFADDRWLFEPKLDGIRALVFVRAGTVALRSRRGNDMTPQYPVLAEAFARQPADTLVLDGEIVALGADGMPSFERLQQRMNLANPVEITQAERDVPVLFYAFDILYLDGVDLQKTPLDERKRLLALTLMPTARIQRVEHFDADGVAAFHAALDIGLEGLVAKRRDSRYESGRRSKSWLKVKARTSDDFVVCGFSDGQGSRAHSFGALVIATRLESGGPLVHAGRVGSGFDDRTLTRVLDRLRPLAVAAPPCAGVPDGTTDVVWVRPEIVAEVEYAHFTAEGALRAPVFLRLRDDKSPDEVLRQGDPSASAPRRAAARTAARASQNGASAAAPGTPAAPQAPAGDADAIASVLEQLATPKQQTTLAVGEQRIAVTNLDKVMWPAFGDQRPLTKRDLIAYYARMSPLIIHHLRDRPLTMTRYPNGVDGKFFYQKHVDNLPGDFVQTVTVHSESGGGDQEYVLVNNLPTLVWLGQMADLALHTSLARANPEPDGHHLSTDFSGSKAQILTSLLNYPDFVLFDLDPYIYSGKEAKGDEPELNRRAFEKTSDVARWLKELLDGAGLSSFVKTSGATGLHIYVPVLRQYDYDTIRGVAETLGGFLLRLHSNDVTMEWAVDRRRGKVFFDANQNARIKNLAGPYSPRAKPGAPVSVPLRWDELGKIYPTEFTILTVDERLAKVGDLWAHILEAKHDLRSLVEATGGA